MPEYKNILTGYVNESKNKPGSHYLVVSNVSNEDVVIKAGEKLYMNRTPKDILDKHPKVPHYSKSIKIEDDNQGQMTNEQVEDVSNDVPF